MYTYCVASVVVIQHLSFAFLTDFHFFRQHLPTAFSTKKKKKNQVWGKTMKMRYLHHLGVPVFGFGPVLMRLLWLRTNSQSSIS